MGGWQSGCRAVCTWGRGQREWSTHEYYGMMAAVGGGSGVGGVVQWVWGVEGSVNETARTR